MSDRFIETELRKLTAYIDEKTLDRLKKRAEKDINENVPFREISTFSFFQMGYELYRLQIIEERLNRNA